MSVHEFAGSSDHPGTVACRSVYVQVTAAAAPDTLSRLLEPLVVMQVLPRRIEAVDPGEGLVSVHIDLGTDVETATRLVRKLSASVVVAKAEMAMEPAAAAVPELAQARSKPRIPL